MGTHDIVRCSTCNEEFLQPRPRQFYLKNPRQGRFCSNGCRSVAHRKKKVEILCQNCNHYFSSYPSEFKYGRRFCSRSCKVSFLFGPNSPAWKGGTTIRKDRLRKSKEMQAWKQLVMARDCYQCVVCGTTENLEVDHIKPRALFPELALEISNGRTLCVSCHKKTSTYMNSHMKRSDFS